MQTVQTRGAAVLKARKLSSAMSASKAVGDHVRDWWFGTTEVKTEYKFVHAQMSVCVSAVVSLMVCYSVK